MGSRISARLSHGCSVHITFCTSKLYDRILYRYRCPSLHMFQYHSIYILYSQISSFSPFLSCFVNNVIQWAFNIVRIK